VIQLNVYNTVPDYRLQIWESIVLSKVITEMKDLLHAYTEEVSVIIFKLGL
jgi:hypothetical protein